MMAKVSSDLFSEKLKKQNLNRVTTLADRAQQGALTAFKSLPLSLQEQDGLKALLQEFATEESNLEGDLESLKLITAEVKAIHTQALLLHGERIKNAQNLLKSYQEGAFTSWLLQTYGNRQTPYNFLQYYEFIQHLTDPLKQKALSMPRQVIYTLATRSGNMAIKQALILAYAGETKQAFLSRIRDKLPLAARDRRAEEPSAKALDFLEKALEQMGRPSFRPTARQKQRIEGLLHALKSSL